MPEDADGLLRLLSAYGVEGQDVSKEATDITPYYWKNPTFRYYLSLAHPEGPAVVELLPRHDDSEIHLLAPLGDSTVGINLPGVRRIEVPTDQDMMAIAGTSPRYPGKFCVHELVAYTD